MTKEKQATNLVKEILIREAEGQFKKARRVERALDLIEKCRVEGNYVELEKEKALCYEVGEMLKGFAEKLGEV